MLFFHSSVYHLEKWVKHSNWHPSRSFTRIKLFSSPAHLVLWERYHRMSTVCRTIEEIFIYCYSSNAGFDRETFVLMLGVEGNFDFGASKTWQSSWIALGRYVQNSGKFKKWPRRLCTWKKWPFLIVFCDWLLLLAKSWAKDVRSVVEFTYSLMERSIDLYFFFYLLKTVIIM